MGKSNALSAERKLAQESFEQARVLLTAAIAKDPEEPLMQADLAQVDAGLGLADEALREADRAIAFQPVEKDPFWDAQWLENLAEVNAQLGRIDEAIKLIERLHAMPNDVISVWELKLDPTWDPLRGDPRFEKSSPHSLRKNSKAHPGRSRERSHARRCLDKFLPDIRAIRRFP